MKEKVEVKGEVKSDIDQSFEKLIDESLLDYSNDTLSKAKDFLNDHLSRDHSSDIKDGLRKGSILIDKYEDLSTTKEKTVVLAALEYLIDPWDIIPDFIGEEGFVDDIYVLNKAHSVINESSITESKTESKYDWVLYTIGGASGPHLAKRAKQLNILNSYQRKALFDIGRQKLYGRDMSRKQLSFFETLVEKVVKGGVLETECPDTPCKYCAELEKVYKLNSD